MYLRSVLFYALTQTDSVMIPNEDFADDPEYEAFIQTLIFRNTFREFMDELSRRAHHIYVLLMHAPVTVAWIERTVYDLKPSDERYPVALFCNRMPAGICDFPKEYGLWLAGYEFLDERKDLWQLRYDPHVGRIVRGIRKREELTVEEVTQAFPAMLALQCREALLSGEPILPTEETMLRYGFTAKDMQKLHDPLASCHARLTVELKAQYRTLHAIERYLG